MLLFTVMNQWKAPSNRGSAVGSLLSSQQRTPSSATALESRIPGYLLARHQQYRHCHTPSPGPENQAGMIEGKVDRAIQRSK